MNGAEAPASEGPPPVAMGLVTPEVPVTTFGLQQ
jgi:hypothetical protein